MTASGADFTATTSSTSSFGAAADFNTVAVSLTNPGTPLANTVGLSATASSNRGVASVVFQAAPANTTDWVTLCTDNVAPYTCAWNTTTIADDSYDLRATATDTAGYARTSTVAARVVDNYILSVALPIRAPMSGNESLTATASNAEGGGLQSLKIQHRAPGAGELDRRLLRHDDAAHLRARHHRPGQRPARAARGGDRSRRAHRAERDDHAHGRQHAADGHAVGPADRHGHGDA